MQTTNKLYMKRFCICLCTIAATLFFVGCHFSENLNLTEDGSGKIEINFDGSEIMKMAGDEVSKEKKENIDSLIVFRDFLEKNKDSISKLSKEEQQRLQKLKDYKMHILVNSEFQEMNMELYRDFKEVSELGDMLSDFKTASVIGEMSNKTSGKGGPNPLKMSVSEDRGIEVSYNYKKGKFSRVTKILDEEKMKKEVDSLGKMKMFLSSSKYKLKYTFPRKIKKISSDKATFSLDMKTLILEVGFMEYMENPKILDVEVELEN